MNLLVFRGFAIALASGLYIYNIKKNLDELFSQNALLDKPRVKFGLFLLTSGLRVLFFSTIMYLMIQKEPKYGLILATGVTALVAFLLLQLAKKVY